MKYLPFAALLISTAGCGIFGGGSDAPASNSPAPADSKASQRTEIQNKIAQKRQELAQVDVDLAKVKAEREQLMKQDASDAKTNRLVELGRIDSDLNLKRSALSEDIAQLQSQIGEGPAPATAKKGDSLDEIIAANDKAEKDEAERRKKKADDDASADKQRIAQAEAARKAELDERAKQKIEGGRLAQGADGPAFEDRWADVILKIQSELQKFKRW
jgi:hypothetical protein